MVRRAAAAAAMMLVLSACGGEPDRGSVEESPTAPPGTPTGASAPPSPPPSRLSPRRELRSALVRLLAARTGSVTVSFDFAGGLTSTASGTYDVESESWEMARELTQDGDSKRDRIRSIGGRTWVRSHFDSGQDWPCWVRRDALPGVQPDPTGAPAPPAVLTASTAVGLSRAGNTIVGTVDLVTATQLVSNALLADGAVSPTLQSTVDARFDLEDGTLARITFGLTDLFVELADAGVELGFTPSRADPAVPDQLQVRFRDLGRPVTIAAPPADEVLETVATATFEDDLAACGPS